MSVIEIDRKLAALTPGSPQRCKGLTMIPLFESEEGLDDYLTLDEALARGLGEVTEVSEGGSVPELRFRNRADKPVLLVDGEELVGSKQNRILNMSILAPARSETLIPVSCVESGRWAWRARSSGTSNRAIYSKLRSKKVAQVSASLHEGGLRSSDQQSIWDDIAEKSERMNAFCDTGASSAIYERHREDLEEFVAALKPQDGQAGAIFVINQRPVGIEVFQSARLFACFFPKLVRSYGLDAIDESDAPANSDDPHAVDVAEMLSGVREAQASRFQAVGLGEDIRLEGGSMLGAALAADGNLVHLAAFDRTWA